jgi:hypothetical protein
MKATANEVRRAADAVVAARDKRIRELAVENSRLVAVLQAVKLRMHFIGWPAEAVWSPNDDGRTIPDWRKEIALVEHALTGCVLPGFPADAVAKRPTEGATKTNTKTVPTGKENVRPIGEPPTPQPDAGAAKP